MSALRPAARTPTLLNVLSHHPSKEMLMTAFRALRVGAPILIIAAAGSLALPACKEATLGPERTGSIEGQVLDFEVDDVVTGVSITTSPPTEAIVTDGEGRFHIADLEVGTYQVTARKSGYKPTTVGILVREHRASSATIFLEKIVDEPPTTANLDISILSWWNALSGDSAFVETEYRVHNPGPGSVKRYEVYFRINTDGNVFFHEEKGDSLALNQSDIRRFRKFIPGHTATGVQVDTFWVEKGSG
jgi:hypothetical protein